VRKNGTMPLKSKKHDSHKTIETIAQDSTCLVRLHCSGSHAVTGRIGIIGPEREGEDYYRRLPSIPLEKCESYECE